MDFRISAVLTTYNRAELARQALESIMNQTLAPAEIIVVEDGGATDLAQHVNGLERDDVRYIRHDRNRGLAAARNTGLRLAAQDWIAYLDDDDRWLSQRLEEQVARLKSMPSDERRAVAAVQVGCSTLDSSGREVGRAMPVNEGNLRASIIAKGAATPSSSFLFLRAALIDVDGFDESLISGIDHDIWMKLAVAGYSSVCVAKPLVVTCRNERETMMTSTDKRIAGIEQYLRKWRPTYRQWLGRARGDRYARRYGIRVISRLAGEKAARWRFREAARACRAVLKWAGADPRLLAFAARCLVPAWLAHAAPGLRRMKRRLTGRYAY